MRKPNVFRKLPSFEQRGHWLQLYTHVRKRTFCVTGKNYYIIINAAYVLHFIKSTYMIYPVVSTITENLIAITDKSITKIRIVITDKR